MSYASQSGRARVSATNPQAHAICDRCGARYNHCDLNPQYDWAGSALVNKQLLVCHRCYDKPQENVRALALSADPVPIMQPRVQDWTVAENSVRATSGQDTVDARTGIPVPGDVVRVTQADQIRSLQQTGEPPHGLNQSPGTDPNAPGNASPGLPLNNTTIPTTGPL